MGIRGNRFGLAGALVVVLALSGCAVADEPITSATSSPTVELEPVESAPTEQALDTSVVVSDVAATSGTALAVLASLPVQPESSAASYQREQFGAAWLDVDDNGCDTRNDILARDLVNEVLSGSCIITTGTLTSAYTGAVIEFVRGQATSGKVQIDHVVALADAWRTGAAALSQAQRESLANDPLNLQAIEGPLNASKSDQDAAEWLPPLASYRCEYVARQVSVKKTYGLWVTQLEHDAIATVLASCPEQPALSSSFTPTVVPGGGAVVAPAPAQPAPAQPAPESAPVSYANCAAVRAAGKAPLHAGDPGYAAKLDRDGDGIACE